jgi:selenocysteine lyase/cysteine desulfurase
VECRIAPVPEEVERFIDDRTRIVSVSSVAFHNGHRADLDAIGEICQRRNVLLCVDAIQSVGVLPIDVKKANVAFLCADGHKWMCGPEGAALFYVAAEHRDELEVLESGWTNFDRKGKFIDCALDLLPDARRFEAGSLNTNGIYGLRAALDLLLEVGVDHIEREVLRLANRLAGELGRIGFTLHGPRPIRSGIVAATPPDVENHSVLWYHRKLEENGVVCAPREGFLRFSPHFYNDDDEIDRVVALLNSFAS